MLGSPSELLGLFRFTPQPSYLESAMANQVADEILESYCTDSRVHAMIHNPVTEGIDEG
mgnify:CR=1 FL=1